MNTTFKTISVILFIVLLATPFVRADDLTTYKETGNDRVSRYLVNLGRDFGSTSRSQTTTDGIFDFPKYKGNGAHWWVMNDGITGDANGQGVTFHHSDPGPNEEYYGYKFKVPATVESLVLQDFSFGDGGFFTNEQPFVQVLTGSRAGTWTTIAATWSPTYDNVNVYGKSTSYTITLDTPAADVWGVRIYGGAAPMADPSGFVACRELQVEGTANFGQVILSNNLARTADATPVMSHAQFPAEIGRITDGSVAKDNSFNTTFENPSPAGPNHWLGVMWTSPKDHLGAVGWTLRIFGDGGWIVNDTLVVEYADVTDGGSTTNWTAVSNLDAMLYNSTITNLLVNRAVDNVDMDVSYLFTFSEVSGADGLRVRGDAGGTAGGEGFISAVEFEAFQVVPEPGVLLGLVAGVALLRRRG